MSSTADILARFSGAAGQGAVYLPDLTLWYKWHRAQDSLPAGWRGYSLPEVARALGAPVWLAARPWRVETPGIETGVSEGEGERVVRWQTPLGGLVARWQRGPGGDWWQTEYPVKTPENLAAAVALVNARSYVVDASELAELQAQVGDDGVLALELPHRPYSDLLHELLGWSDGLLLVSEPAVSEIVTSLELKLQDLVRQVAGLPGELVLSPDNLDGQFISPTVFQAYLAGSYRLTAEVLHERGKRLVVHVGGPVKRLLELLAHAGVDALEGVAGPPQGDASLSRARAVAGPGLTLWGGIPQDFLLEARDREEFEAAVRQAAREAQADPRMILGVADRVPADAELGRLEAIPGLIARSLRKA
jgi:hypothetical protein